MDSVCRSHPASAAAVARTAELPGVGDPMSLVEPDPSCGLAAVALRHALRGWVLCDTDDAAAAIVRKFDVNCITRSGNQHFRDKVVGGYRDSRRSVVLLKFSQRELGRSAEAARAAVRAARSDLGAARTSASEHEAAVARAAAATASLRLARTRHAEVPRYARRARWWVMQRMTVDASSQNRQQLMARTRAMDSIADELCQFGGPDASREPRDSAAACAPVAPMDAMKLAGAIRALEAAEERAVRDLAQARLESVEAHAAAVADADDLVVMPLGALRVFGCHAHQRTRGCGFGSLSQGAH